MVLLHQALWFLVVQVKTYEQGVQNCIGGEERGAKGGALTNSWHLRLLKYRPAHPLPVLLPDFAFNLLLNQDQSLPFEYILSPVSEFEDARDSGAPARQRLRPLGHSLLPGEDNHRFDQENIQQP